MIPYLQISRYVQMLVHMLHIVTHTDTHTSSELSMSACLSSFPSPPTSLSPFCPPRPLLFPPLALSCLLALFQASAEERGRESEAETHRCAVERERIGEGKADRI